MKNEQEIRRRAESRRAALIRAVGEKERAGKESRAELDLEILSLIYQLETLFWVLETDLPKNKIRVLH